MKVSTIHKLEETRFGWKQNNIRGRGWKCVIFELFYAIFPSANFNFPTEFNSSRLHNIYLNWESSEYRCEFWWIRFYFVATKKKPKHQHHQWQMRWAQQQEDGKLGGKNIFFFAFSFLRMARWKCWSYSSSSTTLKLLLMFFLLLSIHLFFLSSICLIFLFVIQ